MLHLVIYSPVSVESKELILFPLRSMPPSGAKGRRSQQWALALRWDALGGEAWAGGVCFGVAAEGRGRFCARKISHPAFIQKAPFLFFATQQEAFPFIWLGLDSGGGWMGNGSRRSDGSRCGKRTFFSWAVLFIYLLSHKVS